MIGMYVYGIENAAITMIGNAILISSFGAIYKVGMQLTLEKNSGTLLLIVASKTKIIEILLSSMLATIISSFITVVLGVSIISFMIGIEWKVYQLVSFVLILLVAIFTAMCFGVLCSIFILLSNEINLLVNTIEKILLIFTGANFPITELPEVIQWFTKFLPLTRSILLAQKLMKSDINIGRDIFILYEEILIGVAYLLMSLLFITFIEKKALSTGSVELL